MNPLIKKAEPSFWENLKGRAETAGDYVSQNFDSAKNKALEFYTDTAETFKDPEALKQRALATIKDPRVYAPLLAGAGTGLLGGALAYRTPQRRGETRAERRKRILRKAIGSGLIGGGATAALGYGLNELTTAVQDEGEGGLSKTMSRLGRLVLAGGAGAGANTAVKLDQRRKALAVLQTLPNRVGYKVDAGTSGAQARDAIQHALKNPKTANQALVRFLNKQSPETLRALGLDTMGRGAGAQTWDDLLKLGPRAWANKGRFLHPVQNAKPAVNSVIRGVRRHPALTTAAAAGVLAPPVVNWAQDRLPNFNMFTFGDD
jgi:hypothetical protein